MSAAEINYLCTLLLKRQYSTAGTMNATKPTTRFLLLLLFTAFIFTDVFSQDEQPQEVKFAESPDTASIFYVQINNRWPGEQLTRLADTVMTGFQYFLPTEGATVINALAGNAGLAYKSLIFNPEQGTGFRYTPFGFNAYRWENNTIRFFQTTGPYSNLYYSTGPAKEQLFSVTHSQNITGGLTVGADVRIINSLGLYERQKSDNVSFAATGQFVNRNEKYVVLGIFRNSRLKWRENGGITDLSMFTENTETDRKRIPIALAQADNQIKESGFLVRQTFYIGKTPGVLSRAQRRLRNKPTDTVVQTATDTLIVRDSIARPLNRVEKQLVADTLGPKKLHRYYDPYRSNFIRHTFNYSRNAYRYTDKNPKSPYYNRILLDSTITYDSVYYHEIVNDISLEAGIGKAKGSAKAVMLRVGVEHKLALVHTDTITENFNLLTMYAYLSANAFGYAKAEGKLWSTTGNPFNGDKGLEGSLLLPGYDNTNKWGNLRLTASLAIEQPFYFYQFYSSNHFAWRNAFGQQTTLSLKAAYEHKYFKAGYNLFNLSDYVYLGDSALPAKADKAVTVMQVWAYTDIRWKYIESQLYGIAQSSSAAGVVNLPGFAARASVYYTRPLFKKALHFQAGVALMYNSPFYEDAYMPALRAFYVQNTAETGGYPYLDAFVNIRVKRAKMYLIMKNVNGGLTGYEYVMIPNYPMPDRGLRLGVSWAFYD